MPFGVWEGGFLKRLFRQGRALQKTGFICMRNACDVKGLRCPTRLARGAPSIGLAACGLEAKPHQLAGGVSAASQRLASVVRSVLLLDVLLDDF